MSATRTWDTAAIRSGALVCLVFAIPCSVLAQWAAGRDDGGLAFLFSLGAVGVLVRRNMIVVFMCVELMLNACNLAFVTFARVHGNLDGQVIAFFVMVVAAAEVVVGLAIIMAIFRTRRSASVDEANLLKY